MTVPSSPCCNEEMNQDSYGFLVCSCRRVYELVDVDDPRRKRK